MRLLHRVDLDLGVQQQPVEQVGGAAFWLADDVKEGQAAEAEQAALPGEQVLLEASLQALGDGLETLGAQREMVLPVGVAVEVSGEPLIPARALDAGKELLRNDGEQLQKDTKCFKKWRDPFRTFYHQDAFHFAAATTWFQISFKKHRHQYYSTAYENMHHVARPQPMKY